MMSSKMLSWIKKRCGRRPEKLDVILKTKDQTKSPPILSQSSDYSVYFLQTISLRQVNKARKENSNDDIYDEIWKSSTISKRVTSHPSPEVQVCPLCRSKIYNDNSCKCVILRRNVRSQKSKTDHEVSLNSTNDSNLSHPSDDDSSGFYESVGSDSMCGGDVYSDNSVTTDSDDGYEKVEFRPTLGHRRRYSIGSLHTVLQRSKYHSTFKTVNKDRNITLRRTIDRRSLILKHKNRKVYIL